MKKFFKGIRKKGQGNKNFSESISLWVDKSISSLHFLSLESRSALPNRQLNRLYCFASARNDVTSSLALGGRGLGRGGNPLQNNATTCAPLAGEPKSLISKGGKNALDSIVPVQNDKKGRHPEGDNPKDLSTQSHVITRKTNRAECGAVCQNDRLSAGHIWQARSHVYGEVKCQTETQSDVVIPNELGNGATCQGLRHWRLLSNLKNNFSKPVRNDMTGSLAPCGRGVGRGGNPLQNDVTTCAPLVGEPKSLISKGGKNALVCNQKTSLEFVSDKNKLDCFASARNDVINKNIKTLVPQCPSALMPFKKKAAFTLAEGATHVDLPPTKVKLAFTLAEVLITLGIIGVVAAMTIPGLINAHQKQAAVTGVKEAQSILNQALKLYSADTDEDGTLSFETTLPIQDFAQKYFVPYLKVARICTKMSDGCWQTGDFNGYYDLAGVKMTDTVPYSIVLNNGMVLGFNKIAGFDSYNESNYDLISIIVDINGKSGRNTMGRDVFSFYLFNNENSNVKSEQMKNGVYPGGYSSGGVPHVQYSREKLLSEDGVARGCNKNATTYAYGMGRPGVGTACAALIFKDGWKISNDYPWN